MGYQKPLSTGVKQRLVSWFLFHRKFPMTIEQFIDMTEVMVRPYRGASGQQYEEEQSMRKMVDAELNKRYLFNKQIHSKPVAYGS